MSTLATTTRASIVTSSMPTSETRTNASITGPLSRIVSTTSARPEEFGRPSPPACGAIVVADAPSSLRDNEVDAAIRCPQVYERNARSAVRRVRELIARE